MAQKLSEKVQLWDLYVPLSKVDKGGVGEDGHQHQE